MGWSGRRVPHDGVRLSALRSVRVPGLIALVDSGGEVWLARMAIVRACCGILRGEVGRIVGIGNPQAAECARKTDVTIHGGCICSDFRRGNADVTDGRDGGGNGRER